MTPDPIYYKTLLERWGRNEPLTALERAVVDCGHGKIAIKAAAQLAEMQQKISDQAQKIEQLQQELNGHGR